MPRSTGVLLEARRRVPERPRRLTILSAHLETGYGLRTACGVGRTVGTRANTGQFAAVHNWILLADRPKPSQRVASNRNQVRRSVSSIQTSSRLAVATPFCSSQRPFVSPTYTLT